MDPDIRRSPWLTIEGGVLVILGVAALFLPFAAGVAVSLVLAAVLIASGVVGLVSAFAGRAHAHRGLGVASAILALAIGALLLVFPLAGSVGVTLLLAAYLLVDGVILIGMAADHRKRAPSGWGWLLVSGVVDLMLAAVLLFLSAAGSAILIGVIVGVDLIVAGVALLLVHRGAGIGEVGAPPSAVLKAESPPPGGGGA
jgi:uncharacterized membrane protein HdeD (DUF308 family)